jgi:hypothetical protein
VHTARAAIALLQAHTATNGSKGLAPASLKFVRDALLKAVDWPNTAEDIVRRDTGKVDRLVVKHFTSTWILRALLASGVPASNPRISAEIRKLVEGQKNGLWRWSDVPKPIWATHDALETLVMWQTSAWHRIGEN